MATRISIQFPDEIYELLREVAYADHTSVARVVRDCVRGALPAMVEVSRFLNDPHTTSDGALRLAADMESMLSRIVRGVGVADGDETPRGTLPRPRSVTRGPNTPETAHES